MANKKLATKGKTSQEVTDSKLEEARELLRQYEQSFEAGMNGVSAAGKQAAAALLAIKNLPAFEAVTGFKNITEYGEHKYRLKSSQVYNMLKVAEKFQLRLDGSSEAEGNFDDYSMTQLLVLSGVKDEALAAELTPEMTVEEMKKKVKEGTPKKENSTQNPMKTLKTINQRLEKMAEMLNDMVVSQELKESQEWKDMNTLIVTLAEIATFRK